MLNAETKLMKCNAILQGCSFESIERIDLHLTNHAFVGYGIVVRDMSNALLTIAVV